MRGQSVPSRPRSRHTRLPQSTSPKGAACGALFSGRGAWNLGTQAGSVIPFPPLSARGIAAYAGIMANYDATTGTDTVTLDDLKILPGMPVEAFVQTGTRSAFSYFLKPLTD